MDFITITFAYNLMIWLIVASVIGVYSYEAKFLDLGGLVAAMMIGTIIFISGGLRWIVPLALFFLLSSILTRLAASRQKSRTVKHSPRTAKQVFANGGVAAAAALGYLFYPETGMQLLFLGSLAAATSDTWSTEIGSFSKRKPWMITTIRRVDKGASGGISLIGSAGGIAGALLLGLSGMLIFTGDSLSYYTSIAIYIVIFAGLFGNIIDSLVGALLQSKFVCGVCGTMTEHRLHCDKPTNHDSGINFIDNEVVNFVCALSGGVFAFIAAQNL
ncbi:DUF92 domain-containing protein [Candidatus Marinimicrobia bacterium MT.SAG.3]|nr:DUF92 domain-containing protein [Candidatus Marinimicrobia bacterium MT.SAG.3]